MKLSFGRIEKHGDREIHHITSIVRNPLFFVCNLKQYLKNGEGRDFNTLLHLIKDAFPIVPPPGPLTYVMHCFDVLYFLADVGDYGVSLHILGTFLSSLDGLKRTAVDDSNAKRV